LFGFWDCLVFSTFSLEGGPLNYMINFMRLLEKLKTCIFIHFVMRLLFRCHRRRPHIFFFISVKDQNHGFYHLFLLFRLISLFFLNKNIDVDVAAK